MCWFLPLIFEHTKKFEKKVSILLELFRLVRFYGVISDEMFAITVYSSIVMLNFGSIHSIYMLFFHRTTIDTINCFVDSCNVLLVSFVFFAFVLHFVYRFLSCPPHFFSSFHCRFRICMCFYLVWPNYSLSCDSIIHTILFCDLCAKPAAVSILPMHRIYI